MMGRGSQGGGVCMFYVGGARMGTEKSGVSRAWSVGEGGGWWKRQLRRQVGGRFRRTLFSRLSTVTFA